jgi:hypothetical protein
MNFMIETFGATLLMGKTSITNFYFVTIKQRIVFIKSRDSVHYS